MEFEPNLANLIQYIKLKNVVSRVAAILSRPLCGNGGRVMTQWQVHINLSIETLQRQENELSRI